MADIKGRVVVIGNSGSGKTTVANRIGNLFSIPVIGLDAFHWQGEGYRKKRGEEEARQLVRQATTSPLWVVEGVFGWLVTVAMGTSNCTDLAGHSLEGMPGGAIGTRACAWRDTGVLCRPSRMVWSLLGANDFQLVRGPLAAI